MEDVVLPGVATMIIAIRNGNRLARQYPDDASVFFFGSELAAANLVVAKAKRPRGDVDLTRNQAQQLRMFA